MARGPGGPHETSSRHGTSCAASDKRLPLCGGDDISPAAEGPSGVNSSMTNHPSMLSTRGEPALSGDRVDATAFLMVVNPVTRGVETYL